MIDTILGEKTIQTQMFLEDGTRIPVTVIETGGNVVVAMRENLLQLGFGINKYQKKPVMGHVKKAGIEKSPRFFREIIIDQQDSETFKPGTALVIGEILKAGDLVQVTGVSKGKGFAGVVKRHHFKGGPRTHGQSDRERAPGSIGQTTTPGRVYKGKRMAGRMGHDRVTIKNLQVVDIDSEKNKLFIKGLVPGSRHSLLVIKKIGEDKKFIPLFKESKKKGGGPPSPEATAGK